MTVHDALSSGKVKILISDGQNQATMKGFGDTRDNIPAIIELAQAGVLSLEDSVATMTKNPAELIAKRTANPWWTEKIGSLGVGALANVTVIDKADKLAAYTIVNGEIVSFENRAFRRGCGAGGWVSKFGMVRKTTLERRKQMPRQSIFDMKFANVFPLLIQKAERKNRTRAEVYEVTAWLTGYTPEQIDAALGSEITYGTFFIDAPAYNPRSGLIKGKICGVQVETINDPLMKKIRQLDKLVDELAKGRPMEKIKR